MTLGDVLIIATLFWCNYWNTQAIIRTSLRAHR